MLFIYLVKFFIKIYHQKNGRAPFLDWGKGLDGSIRARINARIARFEDGHFGDHKSVGDGVMEARFFFGSGYRVYFHISGDQIILLLTGGDKASQTNDMEIAKKFLKSYLEVQNANKK